MALTRKFLTALGIEADKVDEIITAHTEVTDALKEERDKYKADAEQFPIVQQELNELKEAAEKNKDNPYKAQYEDLKKEYEDYKTGIEAKEKKAKVQTAYRELLKKAGVNEKRLDAILKVSALDDVEIDDKGELKDADKLSESIKTEWADFIVTKDEKGANTSTPPKNDNGGGNNPSRAAQVAQRHYENLYGKKGEDK